jgi:hypothetical protein
MKMVVNYFSVNLFSSTKQAGQLICPTKNFLKRNMPLGYKILVEQCQSRKFTHMIETYAAFNFHARKYTTLKI